MSLSSSLTPSSENSKLSEPIFTRYLYLAHDVSFSLVSSLAMFEEDKEFAPIEEILFWAFELYFSGFQETTLEILKDASEIHSVQDLFAVKKSLDAFKLIFKEDINSKDNIQNNAILLANLVKNIVVHSKNVKVKNQTSGQPPQSQQTHTKNKFHINVPFEYIQHLVDVEMNIETCRPYRILQKKCVFEPPIKILRPPVKRDILVSSLLNGNWLYYCINTPVWKNRIEKYNGQFDHDGKKVVFLKESEEDAFYEKYGYEPDENLNLIMWCVGM